MDFSIIGDFDENFPSVSNLKWCFDNLLVAFPFITE